VLAHQFDPLKYFAVVLPLQTCFQFSFCCHFEAVSKKEKKPEHPELWVSVCARVDLLSFALLWKNYSG